MNFETPISADAEAILPDITPIPPLDSVPGGLISWLLTALLGIIAYLWRRSEGQSVAAVNLLNTRLTKAEDDLVVSGKMHKECEENRHELATQLAVNTALSQANSERLNKLEKQFAHGPDMQ